jgi:hypothetical protein
MDGCCIGNNIASTWIYFFFAAGSEGDARSKELNWMSKGITIGFI